jgi:hypothetical protein
MVTRSWDCPMVEWFGGTPMYHEVDRLFDVIACAQRKLTPMTLQQYLRVVGDPNKHENALVEFNPVLRLDGAFSVWINRPPSDETAASQREVTT